MAFTYQNSFSLSNPDLSALNFNIPEDVQDANCAAIQDSDIPLNSFQAESLNVTYRLFDDKESPVGDTSKHVWRNSANKEDDLESMLQGLRSEVYGDCNVDCKNSNQQALKNALYYNSSAPFGGEWGKSVSSNSSDSWSSNSGQHSPHNWTQSSKTQTRYPVHSSYSPSSSHKFGAPDVSVCPSLSGPTVQPVPLGHEFTGTPMTGVAQPKMAFTYAYANGGGYAIVPIPVHGLPQPVHPQPYVVMLPSLAGYGQGNSNIHLHQSAGEPSGPLPSTSGRMNYMATYHTKMEHAKMKSTPDDPAKPGYFVPNKLLEQDIYGNVFRLSRDQVGCRLLQQKIEEGERGIVSVIYEESKKHLPEMMLDPFGNYLFQKLFEKATPLQCSEMLSKVHGTLVRAALNIHGTRSVQKVLETCKTKSQVEMIQNALEPRIVELCLDANGNHVIQKAVQCMATEDRDFIFRAVIASCTTVACHRHGCCVIQRCLDAASREQQWRLVAAIVSCALVLMQDPYGNYVVQYVLDLGRQTEAWAVAEKCLGHVALLSTQKFSSNVMEKCLEKANEQLLASIVGELCEPTRLMGLLQDQYANYVIQRALTVSPVDVASRLVESIKPHLGLLRNTSGGRRIVSKILKRFPKTELCGDFITGLI